MSDTTPAKIDRSTLKHGQRVIEVAEFGCAPHEEIISGFPVDEEPQPATLPFAIHPQHDRIVEDAPAPVQQPADDSLSLGEVESMLSAHPAGIPKTIAGFLLRVVKSMNSRVAELEKELKQKDADYTGVCLEYGDLSDENNRLKQELEISKIVAEARGSTLLQLQGEMERMKATATA